jgi:hypothetical protein
MQIWRTDIFGGLDDLLESVEHIIAYVASPAGSNLGKAWVIKTLSKGYYGPPVGFKSWKEREREETLKRAEARKAERLADFEARTQLRIADLPGPERKRILEDRLGATALAFARPADALQALRDHFAEDEGLYEFSSGFHAGRPGPEEP